jgi:cation diffusion facilitator family transporter
MKKHSDKKVVYAALVGNSAIAVMKFVVAIFSGSAAMLAEGFHSAADSLNQIMLLIGFKRSARPPDDEHPFGYGKVLYFWAFVVSVSIFFVGGALSIYEGIRKAIHPEPITSLYWALIVITISILFEAYPWWIAFSEAKKLKRGTGLLSYVDMAERSKNPTVMVVLFEDTAAIAGLIVAGLGVSLAHKTGESLFDSGASIVIGLILLGLAVFLAKETKGLLIGESASKENRDRIRMAICNVPQVKQCGRLLTMHMGPDDILVNMDVEFVDGLSTDEVEKAVDEIESRVKATVPSVTNIYIEAQGIRKNLLPPKQVEPSTPLSVDTGSS